VLKRRGREKNEEHGFMRKKRGTSVVRSRLVKEEGGARLFISEKGCKDCSRATTFFPVPYVVPGKLAAVLPP